jgi:serine/threonine protein kinase
VRKIGIGFFSDVYQGTWRNRTVAIKVLADTTPRELFIREVAIWKTLKHPNVLELYGASSTTGDPPWFFVSPYEKNGSLNDFLRRIDSQTRSSGSSFGSKHSPHHLGGTLPLSSGSSRHERQATFPIWPGMNSNQLAQPRVMSPARDPEYRKSRDLHRFIYEIAKGMEYLHSQSVHHGDLKVCPLLFFGMNQPRLTLIHRQSMFLLTTTSTASSRTSDKVK